MQKTKFSSVAATFILCFVFWILLTWSIDPEELIAGVIVSLVAALFSARIFIHEDAFHLLKPSRFGALFAYIFVFLGELIKANWDMAKRCYGGCKKVNPGVIRIPAQVTGLYPQAMLANSITLTPGTMTLDIAKDETDGQIYYYIHWIDVTEEDPVAAGEIIKGRMEKWIRRIWE